MSLTAEIAVALIIIGYVLFLISYIKRVRTWAMVLQSNDGKEIYAKILDKKPVYLKYYATVLELPLLGEKQTVQYIFTRNYIDNYRPDEVPIVYSKRIGKTATKGHHELKMLKSLFVLLTIVLAAALAAFIYFMTI